MSVEKATACMSKMNKANSLDDIPEPLMVSTLADLKTAFKKMEQYNISDFASETEASIKQLGAAIALLKPFREYYKRRGTSSVALALQALSTSAIPMPMLAF